MQTWPTTIISNSKTSSCRFMAYLHPQLEMHGSITLLQWKLRLRWSISHAWRMSIFKKWVLIQTISIQDSTWIRDGQNTLRIQSSSTESTKWHVVGPWLSRTPSNTVLLWNRVRPTLSSFTLYVSSAILIKANYRHQNLSWRRSTTRHSSLVVKLSNPVEKASLNRIKTVIIL